MLAAGEPLPAERRLAEQMGVTRHRLRLALEVLRSSGEVPRPGARREASPLRGDALVRSTNALEVIELRMILEPALVRLAAVRATPLDILRIQKAATTPPGVSRGAGDLAFHKQLAEATRNTLVADFYALLRRVGSDSRLHVNSSTPVCINRIEQRDREHKAIADAIADRDPDRAEAAMRAHLVSVQNQIVARLTPGAAVLPASMTQAG
ncbi:MAG: FadR family transcriptional regulator [Pigmentiphaga sp.]|nr:FadR family transcriptional regulator [Pigmentiphaga sp.]